MLVRGKTIQNIFSSPAPGLDCSLPGAHSAGLDCLLTAGAQPEGGRPARGGRETQGGGEAEGAVGSGSPGAQTAALSLVEIPPDTVL